jgi:hypothetical protein
MRQRKVAVRDEAFGNEARPNRVDAFIGAVDRVKKMEDIKKPEISTYGDYQQQGKDGRINYAA